MIDADINGQYVIRAWLHVLRDWLGWTDDRVQRWMQAWADELSGRTNGFFYHETAMYYMTGLLVRDRLWEQLPIPQIGPHPIIVLHRRLQQAIENLPNEVSFYDEAFDWDAAKKRVEQVLAEFGESLPTPDEKTTYEIRKVEEEPIDPEELKQFLDQILPPTEVVPFDVEAAYHEARLRNRLG